MPNRPVLLPFRKLIEFAFRVARLLAQDAVFNDLIRRGLDPSTIQLGIMDGLPGLEGAFLAAFRKATVQRCQVHKAKNVLAKVRKKDRKVVAEGD